MRVGLTISAVAHAAVLLWSVVSFAAKPYVVPPTESLPIDIISDTEFSQMTAGRKDVPKKEAAKPRAEKIADRKLDDNPATKVVDNKPEIVRVTDDPKPPTPDPPKPDPKPVAAVAPAPKDPKPEPKKAEPDPPNDPIAAQLNKSDAKKPDPVKPDPPKQVVKKPDPPKKPPRKYDPNEVAAKLAALENKQDPRRQAIAGDTISNTQSLGTPTGSAALLAQSLMDALGAQIRHCFKVPANLEEAQGIVVEVHFGLRQDGSVVGDPVVVNSEPNALFQNTAEAAVGAIRQCQPYRLPIAKYELWKDVNFGFDPSTLR